MKERNYIVYKHTCPNGKVYIGITRQEPEKRWRNGFGYRGNTYFEAAIKKYGWGNFSHEILFEHLTKEEAESKEIELIALYKSNQRKFGYNIENGGSVAGKTSEETKIKISESHKGQIPWNKGKTNIYSKEALQKMSDSKKGRRAWNKGIPLSEERKKQLIESRKNIVPWNKGKKVYNFHSQETKNKLREFFTSEKNIVCKRVNQYDDDNNLINCFYSMQEAERRTNISRSNIGKCCRSIREHAGGYVWRYADD